MFVEIRDVILGIIQGLTEFLPISSSAHLAIIPWLFGWEDEGLAFDVALHLGTLLALLIYYRQDWLAMIVSVVKGGREQRRLLLFLIVASIPGAIFGLLFEKQAETVFRSPLLIATTMTALGIMLWVFDRRPRRLKRTVADMTLRDAFLIGLSQAFAIIPGSAFGRHDYDRAGASDAARRRSELLLPDGHANHCRGRADQGS